MMSSRSKVMEQTTDGGARKKTHLKTSSFHSVFVDTSLAENQITPFDLSHIATMNIASPSLITDGTAASILHSSYINGMKEIQAVYGSTSTSSFDFQHYVWGMKLSMDENSSQQERLNLLLPFYGLLISNRLSLKEFLLLLKQQSNFYTHESHLKKIRIENIKASFSLHAVRRQGYPETVGKKAVEMILSSHQVELGIDFSKLSKRAKRQDKLAKDVFDLLTDDPLLRGQTKSIAVSLA